jgi:arginine deiminase
MDRRQFVASSLVASAAARAAAAEPPRDEIAGQQQPFVANEIGKLRRVIVHPPGPEVHKAFPLLLGNHSMLTWELLRPEATAQHAGLVAALRRSGAEVLFVEILLDSAIAAARKQGKFRGWLSAAAPALVEHEKRLTAAKLLGSDDELIDGTGAPGEALRPLVRPTTTMFFTRDIAAMTPRGVVLCNFGHQVRSWEAALARLMFRYAPALEKYPIAFEAASEGVFVEGGDVMVLDERTLLVGIGNGTAERAAVKLAQKLEMDVLAVEMPRAPDALGQWDGLQTLFYHLDFLVNFVGRRQVLAVPYLMEKEQGPNSLLDVLYGIARIESYDKAARLALLEQVRSVGWLRRYAAGSGERDAAFGAIKLLDYLRDQGYEAIYVGGERGDKENSLKHAIERVVRECRFLAVNVVAVGEKQVIAYDGNDHTLAALRQAGVEVATFPANELMRANGGPHCLTLPLERD